MQLAVSLCVLLYVVTVTVVGVRMLVLARRTRRLPELPPDWYLARLRTQPD
jgi:hypothetical protein